MKKTRLLCLLLAAMMVLSLFAACGGDNTSSKPVESKPATSTPAESGAASTPVSSTPDESGTASTPLDMEGEPYDMYYMYYVPSEGSNQSKVNALCDELAMRDINMHAHMLPMTMGTANQQVSMMLASGEPLDHFIAGSGNFATYIQSQYVVNLNDYLPELQGAMEVFGDDFNCAQVGDFLVGISQMKERAYPCGLIVRKDLFEELGYKVEDFHVDPNDLSSYDKITEMFAAAKEKWPDMVIYDGNSSFASSMASYADGMGDNFGCLMNYGQDTTVTNYWESDFYKGLAGVMRDWFKAGYILQDIAVSQDGGEIKMKAGNAFCYQTLIKPNTDVEKLAQTGYEVSVIPMSGQMKYTGCVSAMVSAIANQSVNPQKAAQFLNWTFTSQDFNDAINWGIEGEDYIINEDGLAQYPEGVNASNVAYHHDWGWAYPNQFAGHPWVGNPVDIWDQYKEYNDNLTKSKAFGFLFDSVPVANELAALQAVYDQYYKDCSYGVLGDQMEAKIDEFNNALYAAGLQTVMDEKQRQFDAWYAEQQ